MQAWRKLKQEVNQVVMHQLQSVLTRQEGEEGSDSSSTIMIKMGDTSNRGRRGKSKKNTKKNKKQKKNKKREPKELDRGENKKHKASKQTKDNRNSSFSDEGKTYTPEAGTVQDTRRRTSTTPGEQHIMEFSDSISAPAAFDGASFCLRSTAADGPPTMPRPLLVHSVAVVAAPRPPPPTLTEILDRTQEIVASFHEAEITFLRSLAGFSPQQKSPSTATPSCSCSCTMTTMMKNCGHQNYNEEESPPPRAFLPMTPAPEDSKRHMPANEKDKNTNMLVYEDEDELFSESDLAMVATTTTSSSSSVLLDDASSLLWDGEQSSMPSVITSSPIRSMAKFSSSNRDERYITSAFNGNDNETSWQQNLDMYWNNDTTRLLNRNNTPRIVQRGSQEQNERDVRPSFTTTTTATPISMHNPFNCHEQIQETVVTTPGGSGYSSFRLFPEHFPVQRTPKKEDW
ncbi:hypothetical protein ACA910_002540 [Epithemia clementina (nom. ined.)]